MSFSVQAQEVMVTGFPLGVGINVDRTIFEPYGNELQNIANELNSNPLSFVIVTGCADGIPYQDNHDSQNPGLALGRAHALKDHLISIFNIDNDRIIIQSIASGNSGDQYRFASVRIIDNLSELDDRLRAVEQRPPVENRITEVREITQVFTENMGLQFGTGITTSPFGALPIITGAITWKREVFVEAVLGHTFWNDSYLFDDVDLDTWHRIAGGQAYIYPFDEIPLAIVGGWYRFEEVSRLYNEYVKMSEGPIIGLRYTVLDYLSINGFFNPSKHNFAENIFSESKNGQFLFSVNFHMTLGGGK